jgi:hypothetical protein
MVDKQSSQTPSQLGKAAQAARKQARLSQALKENMARRKSQARARVADAPEDTPTDIAQTAQHKDS